MQSVKQGFCVIYSQNIIKINFMLARTGEMLVNKIQVNLPGKSLLEKVYFLSPSTEFHFYEFDHERRPGT